MATIIGGWLGRVAAFDKKSYKAVIRSGVLSATVLVVDTPRASRLGTEAGLSGPFNRMDSKDGESKKCSYY